MTQDKVHKKSAKYLEVSTETTIFATKFQTHSVMIDLKNAKLEDLELIEAPKLNTSKKVRCTFFRVKPGSYKPMYKNRRIADMPKELFHEYFQKGV